MSQDTFEDKSDDQVTGGEVSPEEMATETVAYPVPKPASQSYRATSYKKKEPETVMVRLLNTDIKDNKYTVIDDKTREVYLVPIDELRWTVKAQPISRTVLDAAERPYSWDDEIESLKVSDQDIRIALWRSGAVSEESAKGLSIQQILSRLVSKGIFPRKG